MIDNMLIVEYDPFAMDSRIAICKDGHKDYAKVCSSIEEMVNGIIDLAYSNNIQEVRINGPFAIASEAQKLITETEKQRYSEIKLNVEGI